MKDKVQNLLGFHIRPFGDGRDFDQSDQLCSDKVKKKQGKYKNRSLKTL
jgi:hypothetical protein